MVSSDLSFSLPSVDCATLSAQVWLFLFFFFSFSNLLPRPKAPTHFVKRAGKWARGTWWKRRCNGSTSPCAPRSTRERRLGTRQVKLRAQISNQNSRRTFKKSTQVPGGLELIVNERLGPYTPLCGLFVAANGYTRSCGFWCFCCIIYLLVVCFFVILAIDLLLFSNAVLFGTQTGLKLE